MAEKSLYSRVVLPANKPGAGNSPGTRTYKGMSSIGTTVGGTKLYDLNLIKQDIINHFYIRQGEKLGNPEFGCIIWDILFDPLTESTREAILTNVTEIINFDPRVTVDNIVVSQYEHGLQIECELTYLPYNISEALQFRFDQNNSIIN